MKRRENLIRQLGEWDQLIKSGQASRVRQLCRALNHKSIPRDLLLDYAQIARRVNAPELIVRWFNPIIHSQRQSQSPPSQKEQALYALGLFRLGAFREAESVLLRIDPAQDPQAHFYLASLYINQWNYRRAIPILKRYIRSPNIGDYPRLVGRLNLCASLMAVDRLKSAASEIHRLMARLEKDETLILLKGNLLEVRSELYFLHARAADAIADLETADKLLMKAGGVNHLLVQKRKAIIEMREPRTRFRGLTHLKKLKADAASLQQWEIVRDCDLQEALHTNDRALAMPVYWGSMFPAYRKRILGLFKIEASSLSKTFTWPANAQGGSRQIDLVHEAPTKALQKLFFALTRELYRPLRVTEILDQMFPNEFYNPRSSPIKLNRLISRGRKWLKAMNHPVEIRSHKNSYMLHVRDNTKLLLTDEIQPKPKPRVPDSLREVPFFSLHQWAKELDVPLRAARRQLRALVKEGRIHCTFRGPKTIYKVR